MRSSNPALSEKAFRNLAPTAERMTVQGTVNKSFLLIAMVLVTAYWSWQEAFKAGEIIMPAWYFPVIIGALITAIVLIFKQPWAPFLAPAYALLEGAALGAISAMFETRYPGVVFQAVLLTMGTFVALLLAYKSGLIRATENFKLGVVAATGGIAIIYLINMVMGFWGKSIPMVHEGGTFGIIFSLIVVTVAALNLILDFDFIEKGAEHGAPKYMEWYAAFGLLVTLVWLYLEMLRLLGKARK